MISRLHWMARSTGLLGLGLILLVACTGDTGPAGLVNPGTISGKLTVWEDALFNSLNSPTTIPAGGFTVSLVGGDSTRTATTGPDGSYSISNIYCRRLYRGILTRSVFGYRIWYHEAE